MLVLSLGRVVPTRTWLNTVTSGREIGVVESWGPGIYKALRHESALRAHGAYDGKLGGSTRKECKRTALCQRMLIEN